MLAVARVLDTFIGTCCCHSKPTCRSVTGIIVQGTPLHTVDYLNNARITDTVLASCGHTGLIVSASTKVISAGLGNARLADSVGAGCVVSGIITSGSGTSESG